MGKCHVIAWNLVVDVVSSGMFRIGLCLYAPFLIACLADMLSGLWGNPYVYAAMILLSSLSWWFAWDLRQQFQRRREPVKPRDTIQCRYCKVPVSNWNFHCDFLNVCIDQEMASTYSEFLFVVWLFCQPALFMILDRLCFTFFYWRIEYRALFPVFTTFAVPIAGFSIYHWWGWNRFLWSYIATVRYSVRCGWPVYRINKRFEAAYEKLQKYRREVRDPADKIIAYVGLAYETFPSRKERLQAAMARLREMKATAAATAAANSSGSTEHDSALEASSQTGAVTADTKVVEGDSKLDTTVGALGSVPTEKPVETKEDTSANVTENGPPSLTTQPPLDTSPMEPELGDRGARKRTKTKRV